MNQRSCVLEILAFFSCYDQVAENSGSIPILDLTIYIICSKFVAKFGNTITPHKKLHHGQQSSFRSVTKCISQPKCHFTITRRVWSPQRHHQPQFLLSDFRKQKHGQMRDQHVFSRHFVHWLICSDYPMPQMHSLGGIQPDAESKNQRFWNDGFNFLAWSIEKFGAEYSREFSGFKE